MVALNLPAPYGSIDELVEQGNFAAARDALSTSRENPALVELLEMKLALLENSLPAQVVMNRLLNLMRQDQKLPGAQELYRQASSQAYQTGRSSLAHSHPPPPPKMKKD